MKEGHETEGAVYLWQRASSPAYSVGGVGIKLVPQRRLEPSRHLICLDFNELTVGDLRNPDSLKARVVKNVGAVGERHGVRQQIK